MRPGTRLVRSALVAATVSLAALALSAGPAAAAGVPTLATGTNTPKPEGAVLVRAYVNSQGSAVSACAFLYGPTEAYGQSAPCKGVVGGLKTPREVTQTFVGLTPGATYHFKVTATDAQGTGESEDSTFAVPAGEEAEACPNQARREEQHAAFLPGCRAYELVSSVNKNGADVMPYSPRTQAAADGSAIEFLALGGFGDVGGVGIGSEYIGERNGQAGSSGWSTHSITPPQEPQPYLTDANGMEGTYWGEFSSDLDSAVFRSYSALTAEPNTVLAHNLYLRNDLRTPGPGHYTLLTPSATPVPPFPSNLAVHSDSFPAGASADFRHILFESDLPLTPESTADREAPTFNLYEFEAGIVRLVGLIPPSGLGECGPSPLPACEVAAASQAGRGAHFENYTPHVISNDGSRAIFTVPTEKCPQSSPRFVCGALYLRLDHTKTIQLNASEKTNGGGPGGADPSGSQPATYWDASADASRIFFTSTEALTDDAPVDGDPKLYMYSVPPDGEGHHLLYLSKDREPLDGINHAILGAIGASSDGHTVYFISGDDQLVAGVPGRTGAVSSMLYRWHDGVTEYIGAVDGSAAENAMPDQYVGNSVDQARVSPGGGFLLFESHSGAGLTGYDHGACGGTNPCRELYLYDAETHQLACASCNPDGSAASFNASAVALLPPDENIAHAAHPGVHINHALADEGGRVFFSSGEALVRQDTNGVQDAYEYDLATGEVRLLSTGTSPDPSFFLDASADGSNVFVDTYQRLLGWDGDQNLDVYDARRGGGLPEPAIPAPCAGETCREAARVPLSVPSAATGAFMGPGNAVAHRPKKPKHHHHHKPHGHAGTKRGAH